MTVSRRYRLQYVISDYIMSNLGWLVFNVARYFSLPPGYDSRPVAEWLLHDPYILLGQFLFPLMLVGLYAVSGFYNRPGVKSQVDILGNSAGVSLIGMLLIFFTVLINDKVPERLHNYELMAIMWALLCVPSVAVRLIINNIHIKARRNGLGVFRALIVGDDGASHELARRLSRNVRGSDFNIAGHVPYETSTADIVKEASCCGARVIIVGAGDRGPAENLSLISRLLRTGLDIYVPLSLYQLLTANPRVRSVVSEPLINITSAGIAPSTVNLKRLGDIGISALALVALLPVFAVLALLIRRDSPGPVLYRQERIGYHKRPFRIIKFRTMRTDAETDGPALSSADDPRVTRIGRVMRKYRLDELPQFWNVLVGEMSLVGPRPEREYFARQIVERAPYYNLIHQVRPGITSWGMVKFGYAADVDQMIERLQYDMLYLENVSLSVDLKILFYTVRTVVTGQGV